MIVRIGVYVGCRYGSEAGMGGSTLLHMGLHNLMR
jgi:hypothetical protein